MRTGVGTYGSSEDCCLFSGAEAATAPARARREMSWNCIMKDGRLTSRKINECGMEVLLEVQDALERRCREQSKTS